MKKIILLLSSLLFLFGCSSQTSQSNTQAEEKTIQPGNKQTLVAYFSVTNHTERIANFAQEILDSDLFEIVPKQEYTAKISIITVIVAPIENKMMIQLDQRFSIIFRIFPNMTLLF